MRALKLVVEGIVQGVGFRPFIHRIAVKSGVKGYVRNVGGSEVEIWVEGGDGNLREFMRLIFEEKPPPAEIEEVEVFEEEVKGFNDFKILPSASGTIRRSMIPPDLAICEHCLREVLDPRDRRYRYAFNSCAWCGPRFSMMYRAPYDRENTSMRKYRLCPKCLEEYRDISNVRRYHAQGISCPEDGPRLKLYTVEGEVVDAVDPIAEAAKLVDEGLIVAVKGLGGYHIASLATDDEVVMKLRRRKRRPTKPFAVMGLDVEVLSKLVVMDEVSIKILKSPERPILLLPKREGSPASRYVSPGMDVEGVFTPYTALHYLLLSSSRDKFMIMTSANPKGRPMCITEDCVFNRLRGVVDYVLTHDREIVNRVDDSVVRFTDGQPVMLRRGRGYAPRWVRLRRRLPKDVVAMGAELQTAGAIGFDDKVVLTQFIGDVNDLDTLSDLDRYLKYFIRNYSLNPSNMYVVVDRHPNYLSRNLGMKYSQEWGAELIEVQHHYAHALATAADRGLVGEDFLAILVDGVGYGDDGAVWGGEVMYVDSSLRYWRVGHLEYLPLIGDESVMRPVRFLSSALLTLLNVEEVWKGLKALGIDEGLIGGLKELEIINAAVSGGRYVSTSSTGRILDAVSALLGVRIFRSFEGEPAIALEAYSREGRIIDEVVEDFEVRRDGGGCVVSTLKPLTNAFLGNYGPAKDVGKDVGKSFQYGLGRALGSCVKVFANGRPALKHVLLGGGAAVNDFIVSGIKDSLHETGLKVLLPLNVPANDGGIALGQVVAALANTYLHG